MLNLKKLSNSIADPIFYRRQARRILRRFRKFKDSPEWDSVENLGDVRRAVFAIAHPDDETFASGLICQLVESGCSVEVVCVTRGEGGPRGRWERHELGAARTEEMQRACDVLGIEKLSFLDHMDPVAGTYRVFAPDVSVAELANQLRPFLEGADLVVSHGSSGEYWHPAHLLVFEGVAQAVASLKEEKPLWLTAMARQPGHELPLLINWDDEAHLRIDVAGTKGKRLEALRCHETQLNVFERFAGGDAESYFDRCSVETYSVQ